MSGKYLKRVSQIEKPSYFIYSRETFVNFTTFLMTKLYLEEINMKLWLYKEKHYGIKFGHCSGEPYVKELMFEDLDKACQEMDNRYKYWINYITEKASKDKDIVILETCGGSKEHGFGQIFYKTGNGDGMSFHKIELRVTSPFIG